MNSRSVLLISPYFPPSNLAGVQRVRLMTRALKNYGWIPIVLTVDAGAYEEASDFTSLRLLPPDLRIERVRALPKWLCRPIGVGDISLRALWALRSGVTKLIQAERPSIIFTTVLPGYTGLVGSWARRHFSIPFVLDYQDPWVPNLSNSRWSWGKANVARSLARWLEPKMLQNVDAITAVSDETLDTVRQRKLIQAGTPIEIIPIGADENDHAIAANEGKSHIVKEDGVLDLAYLGTLTERMLPALETLLVAIRQMLRASPQRRSRLHLIGTSAQPNGQDKLGIVPMAREIGVGDMIKVEPRRVPYLDALRTMQDADVLMLLGSTDSHYTASKFFPCWLSRKPVLALFHARSTVNELAQELGGVRVVNYNETETAETRVNDTAAALREILENGPAAVPRRNNGAFELYSSRGVAQRYAALFDRVLMTRSK